MTKTLDAMIKQRALIKKKYEKLDDLIENMDERIDEKVDAYREKLEAGRDVISEEFEETNSDLHSIEQAIEKQAEKLGVCINFD